MEKVEGKKKKDSLLGRSKARGENGQARRHCQGRPEWCPGYDITRRVPTPMKMGRDGSPPL